MIKFEDFSDDFKGELLQEILKITLTLCCILDNNSNFKLNNSNKWIVQPYKT
jgi:hypothetical protein